MESNYYQIYKDSVFLLAESLVVKSSDTATADNDRLYLERGPGQHDPMHPETWRYYLHLAGRQHFSDVTMHVVSMDTLEQIEFTPENLEIHRATRKAYTYGTRHYRELVARYPLQERLIFGVLYPADLLTAVQAKNGTILSYPSFLVEDYEYSLIRNLQTWIYGFLGRYDNTQFKISENMYSVAILGVLYVNLVPAIMTMRLQACKTNEVHSYHLRQYLGSHGLLDAYTTFMTRHQQLFLYRNIAYIERNSGKQAVFEWLTEHIMTHRGLPLGRFEMRHNLTDSLEDLTPVVEFVKIPLNTEYNYDGRNVFSLPQVFDKEDPLARDNIKHRDLEQEEAVDKMEFSLSNQLQTKLLESTIIDYTGSEHFTLADTLLYHWLYLSSIGQYKAYVGFTNPRTGEFLSLTAKDAFEFYTYLHCESMGIQLLTLPAVIAARVIRVPKTTVDDLMTVVDPKRVSRAFAQEMLNLMVVPQAMISIDSFYEYCVELHANSLKQYEMVCAEEITQTHGEKHGMMNRCWADVGVQLGTAGQTYLDWFAERNLDIDELTSDDKATIMVDLLEAATGVYSSSAITLKDMQAAMLSIMGQLGSYTVQYVSSINQGPMRDAPNFMIRVDDITGRMSTFEKLNIPLDVLSVKTKAKQKFELDLGSSTFDQTLLVRRKQIEHLEITVKPLPNTGIVKTKRFINTGVGIGYELGPMPPNPRRLIPVLGIDKFLALPESEQLAIPDTWI